MKRSQSTNIRKHSTNHSSMVSTTDLRFRGKNGKNVLTKTHENVTLTYIPIFISSAMFFILLICFCFCLLWNKYSSYYL